MNNMIKGKLFRSYITVFDPSTTKPVTGLTDSDFSYLIIVNGVKSSETLTISEVEDVPGKYKIEHTPQVIGERAIEINYTPLEFTWSNTYNVSKDGILGRIALVLGLITGVLTLLSLLHKYFKPWFIKYFSFFY